MSDGPSHLNREFLTTLPAASTNSVINIINTTIKCIPVTSKDYPDDPISQETEQLVTKLRGVTIMPVMFIIGTVGTSFSLAVFYKQGLNNRINLCLFSLELVNLVNVSFLVLLNIDSLYRTMDEGLYGDVFRFIMNNRLLGMLGFMYCSMYLTALASCERCVSVLFPLHSKTLLSNKAILVFIILGGCATIFPFFFVVNSYQAACLFDMQKNKSTLGVLVTELYFKYSDIVQGLEGIYYGAILSLGIPIIVLISTAITGFKLVETITFRKQTSSSDTKRETAATKMLVILSVQFLILSIPNIVIRMVPLFEPEVRNDGRYNNSFLLLVNCAETGSIVNSSGNFFVYYFAGTRFRQAVCEFLSRLRPTLASFMNSRQNERKGVVIR